MKEMRLSDLGAFEKGHDPLKNAAKNHSDKMLGKNIEAEVERGVSSTSDHLLDIPEGEVTNLNTVEYKYYGFFHRIKQKLEQFWGRSIQEKAEMLLSRGRTISVEDEHITALEITMNETGEILEIVIKGTSGVKELDDAAIESFNDAGPFPNPPKGLIKNGLVTIQWGFVVKT
jgi:protein TonB